MNETERYIALANLKTLPVDLDKETVLEMWHSIRAIAVLDFALRQPEHALAVKFNEARIDAGAKFETIVRKVQKLALHIQEIEGYTDSQKPN